MNPRSLRSWCLVALLAIGWTAHLGAQRRLATLERRVPNTWCPMVAQNLGSLGIRFLADANRLTFTFSLRGGQDAQQTSIDNIVILRASEVPDIGRYSIPEFQLASQLGQDPCMPNGSSLNFVLLDAEIPESVAYAELFPNSNCSGSSSVRQCWNFPSGVNYRSNDTAPDNPGANNLRFNTGSIELSAPAGGSPVQTRVSVDGFVPLEEYILTGWLLASAETPDFSFEIFVEPVFDPPANDFCVSAVQVGQTPFTDIINVVGASEGPGGGEPTPSCAPTRRTVWYEYTAPSNGTLVADTTGSDFNTQVTAYQGNTCFQLQERACNDDTPEGTRAVLRLPVEAGQTYRLQAGGRGSLSGNLVIRFNFEPSFRTYLPQVAVGGPISTTVSLLATSNSTPTSGVLSLFDDNGSPLQATSGNVTAAEFPVELAAGGSSFTALRGGSQPVAGWAVVETDQPVDAVATFRILAGNTLQSVAGVLGSDPLQAARLPVEDAAGTGLALANPGDAAITVRLTPRTTAGGQAATPEQIELAPGAHLAAFIPQLFSGNLNYQGSLVVEVVGPGTVAVTGLVVDRGLLTAIPIVRIR